MSRRTVLVWVATTLAACQTGTDEQHEQAELVLHNAHIVTKSSVMPEAEAIAVAGGRILAVGADDDMSPYATILRGVEAGFQIATHTRVLMTFLGGKLVFEAAASE